MKSKIKHIIKFEFLRAAKTKGFIIGIILVPLMFIGMIAITKILAEKSTDHSEDKISVGVCTAVQDSTFAEIVQSIKSMNWEIVESPDKDALRSMTFEKKIKGYIEYDSVAGYNFYADNYTDLYVSNTISGIVYNINRKKERSDTMSENNCSCCRHKATPRSEANVAQLQNRLNRMIGQMNGIKRMLDDNRYCGDIVTQVAAVESALQSFGYLILQDHMETCVAEEIKCGNSEIINEAVDLIKKLK